MKEEDDYIDGPDPEDPSEYFDGPQGEKKKRKSAAGRKLIRWSCEVDQLVLLCVDHVCTKQGVVLPWDLIGKEVNGTLTGEAIKQHLVKVRKARELHGQQIPPRLAANERRRANNDHPPVTPVNRRADLKTEDPSPELPMSSLIYVPPKKAALITASNRKAFKGSNKADIQQLTDIKASEATEQGLVGRGSKRARSMKKHIKQEESDSEFGTPIKKTKKTKHQARPQASGLVKLRELTRKDYTELCPDEDIFRSAGNRPEENDLSSAQVALAPATTTSHIAAKVSTASDFVDVRQIFNRVPTNYNYKPSSSASGLQHQSNDVTAPQFAIGNANNAFDIDGSALRQTLDRNYQYESTRTNGFRAPQSAYGGIDGIGLHNYPDEVTAPRAFYNETNTAQSSANERFNTFPARYQASPSLGMFSSTESFAPVNDFIPVNDNHNHHPHSLVTSSINHYTSGNDLAESQSGNIYIANDTGRGQTTITPTTAIAGYDNNRRFDGLPQTCNPAGDPFVDFNSAMSTGNDQSHAATERILDDVSTTPSPSGPVTYGMKTLGLDSGLITHSQPFGGYDSFNHDNTQYLAPHRHEYSNEIFDVINYEQQNVSDELLNSPLIDFGGGLP